MFCPVNLGFLRLFFCRPQSRSADVPERMETSGFFAGVWVINGTGIFAATRATPCQALQMKISVKRSVPWDLPRFRTIDTL